MGMCVCVRRTSEAAFAVRGISFDVVAQGKKVRVGRRGCVGPDVSCGVDANGGDSAVSGRLGPI